MELVGRVIGSYHQQTERTVQIWVMNRPYSHFLTATIQSHIRYSLTSSLTMIRYKIWLGIVWTLFKYEAWENWQHVENGRNSLTTSVRREMSSPHTDHSHLGTVRRLSQTVTETKKQKNRSPYPETEKVKKRKRKRDRIKNELEREGGKVQRSGIDLFYNNFWNHFISLSVFISSHEHADFLKKQ